MYQYIWDEETGGLLLTSELSKFSKEPRPVYYRELDILGFDAHWTYPRDDRAPLMWAEANNYIYKGRQVAHTRGGSLYTKPEIILDDAPEPDGGPLQFVDVARMCEKNREIMESLAQGTIQQVYKTYLQYKKKIDIFHVSFSGGKDSVVCLDIVERALPHDGFIVLFGDTGMEFPDTLDVVKKVEEDCERKGISFHVAKSDVDPLENWRVFGPPATTLRWCCSVHKTTPQQLFLRDVMRKAGHSPDMVEMAFVGVRAEESARRSTYEYISKGTKHKGQYSCNPILEWGSAEVYLYIYLHDLVLNETYKKGNGRAGCLVCPMAGDKQEYMRRAWYREQVDQYISIIQSTSARDFPTQEDDIRFINNGGWKSRTNGRDIKTIPIKYNERTDGTIELIDPFQRWQEWMKTVGKFYYDGEKCTINFKGTSYDFYVHESPSGASITLPGALERSNAELVKHIKYALRKAAYCVACRECEADCPNGCLSFSDGKVQVSDSCIHCMNCHKATDGCLLYKSLNQPKGNGNMKSNSINRYGAHAPKREWIRSFFELQERFDDEHELGTMMYSNFKRFLRDVNFIDAKGNITDCGRVYLDLGEQSDTMWSIMLVNLSYTPEIGWYVHNIPINQTTTKADMSTKLQNSGTTERSANDICGAFKRILALPFGDQLGLGQVYGEKDDTCYIRDYWHNPIPEVILYSLYRFAEECGDFFQFTLSDLMDDTIERDGVSPTRIFGLDRDSMVRILNGLSRNYSGFINAEITHDLETITLHSDKSANDVLALLVGAGH